MYRENMQKSTQKGLLLDLSWGFCYEARALNHHPVGSIIVGGEKGVTETWFYFYKIFHLISKNLSQL